MPSDADRRLERLAERQRGQFALLQAKEAGVPRSTVYQRLADGRYLERYPSVFRLAGSPDSRSAWYQAAVLALSTPDDPAYLSHRSAAHLWRFDGCRPDDVIHLLSTGHHPREIRGVQPHRTRTLPDHHACTRAGIPVTGPERTICDLARQVGFVALRRAVADGVRRKLVTVESLAAVAFELGRFRGKRAVRRIVEELSPLERDTVNEFESLFLRIMTWAGAPPSALNHPVTDADGRRRKLDAVYLPGDYAIQIPVWIELDGKFAHSEVLDVSDDRAREDAVMRAGWPEPLRFTWWELVRCPKRIVGEVVGALEAHRVSGGSDQLD